jgi:hypothetical protein
MRVLNKRTCGSDLQGSSEDPKELFQLGVRGRSSDREVADPTGVGGLHQELAKLSLLLLSDLLHLPLHLLHHLLLLRKLVPLIPFLLPLIFVHLFHQMLH